jgi:hypothetical protein
MSRPGVVLQIAVWVLAIALAAVAYLMPLNVNDFLKWLVRFERDGFAYSWWAEFGWTSSTASDWRPLQLPIGHTLYLVGRGHEHLVFKGLLAGSIR